MRRILFYILTLISVYASGQSMKYAQLERCMIAGQPCDSCFRMTSSTGYLTKCLTLSQIRSVIGEQGTITANPDGTYTYSIGPITFGYTCTIVNDTIIQLRNYQDSVASECVITGLADALDTAYISQDTVLTFETKGGTIFSIDLCPVVRKCETLTELLYSTSTNTLQYRDEAGVQNSLQLNNTEVTPQPDGSYKFKNEILDSLFFGYQFECINDTSIAIKNWQGDVVDTCIVGTGSYGIDIFCDTDGSYKFTKPNGVQDTLTYRFFKDSIATTGYLYMVNGCGYVTDSVMLGTGGELPELVLDIVNDTFEATNCLIYINTVKLNDTLCNDGTTVYSYVNGSAIGGNVTVDADGNFIFTFTDCIAANQHKFSVMACCIDGTCDYSDVIITLPSCGSANSVDDNYQGQRGVPIVFSTAPNDVACQSPKKSTYTVQSTTQFGTLYINTNGSGVYYPLPWFTGRDSAYVVLRCDGVICDSSWLKFNIITSNVFDDFYIQVNGSTRSGLNNTSNDVPCTPPANTTYDWNGLLFPSSSGTITGTPSSFSFQAANNFCGVAMRQYDQFCDNVLANTATSYFYVSCGNAIDDIFNFFDTTGQIIPHDNDNVCTNGGITTWHLAAGPTIHGTGLSVQMDECLGDGCPSGIPEPGAIITAWDTTTGVASIKLPTDFSGEVCFKYFLKCKAGGTQNVDTACVKIVRILTIPTILTITQPDTLLPNFVWTMGAKCVGLGGQNRQLENGDRLRVTMATLQGNISVDLIVGGNIKAPGTGYTNDASGRWASWVVPSITTITPVLNRTSLFNGTFQFSFRKDTFAKRSNNWGDGLVTAAKIGQNIATSLRVIQSTCGRSPDSATAVIPKCYDFIHYSNSVQEIWESGGPLCSPIGAQNMYMQWGQFAHTLGFTVPYIQGQNIFPVNQVRCGPTLSYNNLTKAYTNGSSTSTGGYIRYQTCLSTCGISKVDTITARNTINHPALLTSNISFSADTCYLQAIDRFNGSVKTFLCGGAFMQYGSFGGNTNIVRSNLPLYVWGWNTYPPGGTNIDTIRTYYNTTPGGNPLAGGTFAYFDIPFRNGGRNWPSGPPFPEIPHPMAEGRYLTYTRIYDEGWRPWPYQTHVIYRYSY